ncbi:hypothetical protein F7725_027417 [Dissostichus mawsoni]|uniref:Uncharacterized protein n=1 Tax=Dissostichus mawsoni TaxID=36200 RepID=A0A7J5XDS2_DISMA|nr:hypothetical protein F7725_027417 [Dissostichus mawsoni]
MAEDKELLVQGLSANCTEFTETEKKFQEKLNSASGSVGSIEGAEWSSSRAAHVSQEATETGKVRNEPVGETSESRLSGASCHLHTMACLPGFSWVFLSALLHAVAPWGAHRPERPRQCDAPKST